MQTQAMMQQWRLYFYTDRGNFDPRQHRFFPRVVAMSMYGVVSERMVYRPPLVALSPKFEHKLISDWSVGFGFPRDSRRRPPAGYR